MKNGPNGHAVACANCHEAVRARRRRMTAKRRSAFARKAWRVRRKGKKVQ